MALMKFRPSFDHSGSSSPESPRSESTTNSLLDPVFEYELPYFPSKNYQDPVLDLSTKELMLDGFISSKYASDGFLAFHSLKLCSSNARQMSKYFQLSMGFTEIAYKGLENDSRLVGSHVVRNGDVIIDIVNTLETVEDDNLMKFPYFEKDLTRFREVNNAKYIKEFKVTTDDLVFDFVNSRIDGVSGAYSNGSSNFGRKIYQKVLSSRAFKNSVNEYNKIIVDTINNSESIYNDVMECTIIQKFLKSHGEGVIDIAFLVEDVEYSFSKAINSGAGIIRLPKVVRNELGSVKMATINVPKTDLHHTLIQNIDYIGMYLPTHSEAIATPNSPHARLISALPPVNFGTIDHCVENYSWNQMMEQAKFYARMFGFHKFWSVDEQDVFTGQTALRSIVMASGNGKIKMPINEPAKGAMKSQIEEFHDFNGGPGVQHIALKTTNIVQTVESLIQRGIEFNTTPATFYKNLGRRLKEDDVVLHEDLKTLQRLNILVDYDPKTRNKKSHKCNYILQIFTKPLHDRPTLFLEIIQRYHHDGFGKGTFKGLFESIEEQQKLRGTLVPSQ